MKTEMQNGPSAVAWAAAMIGVAFVAAFAHRHGYLDDHANTAVIAMNGLWLAWYGNRIPKAFAAGACARQVKRVAGWSLVLSGFVYVAVFVFAPLPLALTVGTAAVLSGILVPLGYCLWLTTKAKAPVG